MSTVNIDRLLKRVQKPTRYSGGELNSVIKDPAEVKIRYAFAFPDTYEVGMSHLGIKILYHCLNLRPDTYCERVYAPWIDMEEEMRKEGVPLFSIETRTPVSEFDFLGVTLQYEMSYTNILNMLDLAGIPLRAKDRGEDAPFVNAGGPCAYNPEPLAEIFDFFTMGEGEDVIDELMDAYLEWKAEGGKRIDYLKKIAKIEGIYVPCLYDVEYNEDGTLRSMTPNCPEAKPRVKKRIIENLDEVIFPESFIVPFMDIVHDRVSLEVFRGCIRGCRFCQAGMIYRPVREKSPERLEDDAKRLLSSTGYEEMSLSSLSTSDYTHFEELADRLLELTEKEKVGLSLPSLRVDNFSLGLMERVQKVRKSGLTFAPEAGSQRLRDVINKNVSEEDLIRSVSLAFDGGWITVKLYFMIGLPYETDEDIAGIARLSEKVVECYYASSKTNKKRAPSVNISVASFVPKPFTPFQWAEQNNDETLRRKQLLLKDEIHNRHVKYSYHQSDVSILEGVFARGDRKLNDVLIRAFELGCKLDSWNECFDMDKWHRAFDDCGIDMNFYTRERGADELFPWDFVDIGVTKEFLAAENEKAKRAETTPHCRQKCSNCGAASLCGDGRCSVYKKA
ncbi:MAG: TIGR03960 family B12-binding radical SAM protein [Oscillospiraceae bacterium]|nr:TIGR03960 family B12-binding radical SAM protein [Oscillospiraceae bacterium]